MYDVCLLHNVKVFISARSAPPFHKTVAKKQESEHHNEYQVVDS